MEKVIVRDVYTVDTISKGNSKAWVKLTEILKEKTGPVEFDFKGIEVVQPWATPEFKAFMQNEQVHLRLWCSENTVNSINIMCALNGFSADRAVNEEVVPEKKLTKEEKQIIKMAEELQGYFDTSSGVATLNIHKRFDQIGVPITVSYIEAALKKYANEHDVNHIILEADGIAIQANVIETVTNLIEKMEAVGVKLEIRSNNQEVMNKVSMYKSLSKKKIYSSDDKLPIIKATLYKGKVGMLVKYKNSKAVDEFGRSGKGQPVSCRVAVYLGLKKNEKGYHVQFRTYNGNTFYTRTHWALEHDNEILDDLDTDIVNIPIDEFGMYNDFLGSRYHLLTPVQNRIEDSTVMFSLTDSGNVTRNTLTIPERIKAVFDDWGVEYDQDGVEDCIRRTKDILGIQ